MMVISSIEKLLNDYKRLSFDYEDLKKLDITHMLILEQGLVDVSFKVKKEKLVKILANDYKGILEEKVENYKGFYGKNSMYKSTLKEELTNAEALVTINYSGLYYSIMSSPNIGQVLIPEEFLSKVKLKEISFQ